MPTTPTATILYCLVWSSSFTLILVCLVSPLTRINDSWDLGHHTKTLTSVHNHTHLVTISSQGFRSTHVPSKQTLYHGHRRTTKWVVFSDPYAVVDSRECSRSHRPLAACAFTQRSKLKTLLCQFSSPNRVLTSRSTQIINERRAV